MSSYVCRRGTGVAVCVASRARCGVVRDAYGTQEESRRFFSSEEMAPYVYLSRIQKINNVLKKNAASFAATSHINRATLEKTST